MSKSAFIYLDTVLDQKTPVYVRNISATRGIVCLTLNDGGGRTHREPIPNCTVPICLSNKATPDMIRNSKSLREFLDKGALELVPHEAAEAELEDPEVRERLLSAYTKMGYSNASIARNSNNGDDISGGAVLDTTSNSPDSFENQSDRPITFERPEEGPEARVQYIIEAQGSGDMKARAAKHELMNIDLTKQDLTYIINASSGIVQKYAKEEMSKRVGNDSHIETV